MTSALWNPAAGYRTLSRLESTAPGHQSRRACPLAIKSNPMPSAIWTGSISFGLVQVPVRLVGATKSKDVSFNQLEEGTGARIRYKKVSEATGEEVTRRSHQEGLRDLEGPLRDDRARRARLAATEGFARDRDRGVRRPRRDRPRLLRAALLPRARQDAAASPTGCSSRR